MQFDLDLLGCAYKGIWTVLGSNSFSSSVCVCWFRFPSKTFIHFFYLCRFHFRKQKKRMFPFLLTHNYCGFCPKTSFQNKAIIPTFLPKKKKLQYQSVTFAKLQTNDSRFTANNKNRKWSMQQQQQAQSVCPHFSLLLASPTASIKQTVVLRKGDRESWLCSLLFLQWNIWFVSWQCKDDVETQQEAVLVIHLLTESSRVL